jgi:hypothetical protein
VRWELWVREEEVVRCEVVRERREGEVCKVAVVRWLFVPS